ncbi:hypothetical protein NNG48_07045 [Enterococcus faecium]|nr:hypothetical protein [Enterococcus faecium]
MVKFYDLSEKGVKEFESKTLYTIEEMEQMSNKKRWAEIACITHFENWHEDEKKVNTAQTLMFLIEYDKGYLEEAYAREMLYIEQYEMVKLGREKDLSGNAVAGIMHRDPKLVRRIFARNDLKVKPKGQSYPVIAVLIDGTQIEFPSVQKAAESDLCDLSIAGLRLRLSRDKVYNNEKAGFFLKEV